MSEDVHIVAKLDSSPVLHIVVIGFHHQKGAEVQFDYPKFQSDNLDKGLPIPWKPLLHLALPDGAHNHGKDFIFFNLPCLQKYGVATSGNVFGVACFQQISSKDLKVKEDGITRGTVQKSVVLILKLPLYGFVLSKLSMITQAYFNQQDFSQTDILKDAYVELTHSLVHMTPSDSIFHMGLSLRELVTNLKEKVLIILKLLLLERKVVFWGSPAGKVCMTILSLLSLFPGFFDNIAKWSKLQPGSKDGPSAKDQYGLPLDLFEKGYILHPYLSLQQMGSLKSDHVIGYVIGTSNILYKNQTHCSWDAFIDLETDEITIPDSHLCGQLSLTTEDLRFTEFVSSAVADHQADSGIAWDGSEDWVRIQFKYYMLCLLASCAPERGSSSHIYRQFNEDFIKAWKHTNNYVRWCHTKHLELESIHQGHPFEGGLTFTDLKIRLKSRIGVISVSNDSRQRMGAAVQRTGEAVGNAYNSAKSTLSSWKGWFTGIVEEINDEMSSNSTNLEYVDSNDKEVQELSEDLDQGMVITGHERTHTN